MNVCSETNVCLVAHLYQIRTPKKPTFHIFFKQPGTLFITQITRYAAFNFFLHIDNISPKKVLLNIIKSNTKNCKNRYNFKCKQISTNV